MLMLRDVTKLLWSVGGICIFSLILSIGFIVCSTNCTQRTRGWLTKKPAVLYLDYVLYSILYSYPPTVTLCVLHLALVLYNELQ